MLIVFDVGVSLNWLPAELSFSQYACVELVELVLVVFVVCFSRAVVVVVGVDFWVGSVGLWVPVCVYLISICRGWCVVRVHSNEGPVIISEVRMMSLVVW